MAPASLLVYGDASVDISMRISGLPAAGLDTAARNPSVTAGGSAANCAAAAARLGAGVDLVARVGDDLFSRVILEDLVSHGVGTGGVEVTPGSSALVVALIDPGGQRTFISSRGPASGGIAEDVYLPLLDRASMVHVSGYAFQDRGSRTTALHLLGEARRRGLPTSVDPSPLFAERYDPRSGWLRGIDYLFPNAHEASAITGLPSPKDASQALRSWGARAVVVTMGADGCLVNDESGFAFIPAFTGLGVVDTTGAGDGFAGGFLAVTLSGGSARQACVIGNLVAARVIANVGGHAGIPGVEETRRMSGRLGDPSLQEAVEVLAAAPKASEDR